MKESAVCEQYERTSGCSHSETCPACGQNGGNWEWQVCPRCGYHRPIGAHERLFMLLDHGSFQELNWNLPTVDPLKFPGYAEKLDQARKKTGISDATVSALGTIEGHDAVFAALDSRFLMGSMGCVVGEAITRTAEYAGSRQLPLVIFSASGGARMQEGIFSLMQMAKSVAAIRQFQDRGGLYISCLTHPTTGGVTASFASMGDIMLAEPGALIGFAGPRLIEQTIGEKLPEGFQRSEFLLAHGFLDQVVPRSQWRSVLGRLLVLHSRPFRRHEIC